MKKTSGDLFVADPTSKGMWPASKLTITNGKNGEVNRVVNSLGRDSNGQLYVLGVKVPDTKNRFKLNAGEVLQIKPPGETNTTIT